MILALDVGNTNVVLGCFKNNELIFESRVSTDLSKTEYQYAVEFKSILEMGNINIAEIDGCVLSSVVPPLVTILKKTVKIICGLPPMVLVSGLKTGLNIKLDNPAQLGSDQVADAVAAINEYPLPAIIFDIGTATTVSVIDEKANYLGGMILPGIKISQEALSSRTSQLPKISLEPPKNTIGKNTIDCMKSGAIYGNAAMIDGIIDIMEKELGQSATAIATGGLSDSIVPYCNHKIIIDNGLLLKGLKIIYDKNK